MITQDITLAYLEALDADNFGKVQKILNNAQDDTALSSAI